MALKKSVHFIELYIDLLMVSFFKLWYPFIFVILLMSF